MRGEGCWKRAGDPCVARAGMSGASFCFRSKAARFFCFVIFLYRFVIQFCLPCLETFLQMNGPTIAQGSYLEGGCVKSTHVLFCYYGK